MNALGWLVLGLLIGWAIEFAIDFLYWRKKAREEAEALAQQESVLLAQQTELGHRQATLRLREKEMADLQASLASRDAELLQQARRVEERSDDLSRVEQAIEKRRADLDRMGLTLNERDKEIATRGEQLRAKEVNYNRRLDTLEGTEAELARRVAVVSNREEAMQSWEGRILSREHDVADREASVNYHASRIANDAAGYEAVKHLLKQHYRTAEGRDRLQALVGIDDRTVELLDQSGIRTFERLAETSMGELTRLMEGAGPRFALANPLSWAEQAGLLLAEDWVGLDHLQAELKGEKRENVAESMLAALRRRPGAGKPESDVQAAGPLAAVSEATASQATVSEATASQAAMSQAAVASAEEAVAEEASENVSGTLPAQTAAPVVQPDEEVADTASTINDSVADDSSPDGEGAMIHAGPASAVHGAGIAAASLARAALQKHEQDDARQAGQTDVADDQAGASASMDASGDAGIQAEVDAEAEGTDDAESTLDQESVVWAPDAGDEYEVDADEALASVFVNPRRERTAEHVVAEAVDADQSGQDWRAGGNDVSDANVLSEHAAGTAGHAGGAAGHADGQAGHADQPGAVPASHSDGQPYRH